MRKILITGAHSYIGTSFENYLKSYNGDYQVDTIDLKDGKWRDESFSGYDVIFHVAGLAHEKETRDNAESYFKINRDLAVDVAAKAKADGVGQFIFLSSMSVYGLLTGRITRETTLKPKTNYGKSKLEAEEGINALRDERFRVCILRPPMIYGKGCKGNYQPLRKFACKLRFFPYIKNERSMLYIENLCEFVRLMILNEESGVFFPQNSEYVNTSKMVKMIAVVNGKKLYLVHGFGWAIKLLGLFMGLVRKAFGSLTYETEMSEYKEAYAKFDLTMSIERTEKA